MIQVMTPAGAEHDRRRACRARRAPSLTWRAQLLVAAAGVVVAIIFSFYPPVHSS